MNNNDINPVKQLYIVVFKQNIELPRAKNLWLEIEKAYKEANKNNPIKYDITMPSFINFYEQYKINAY